MIKLKNSQLQFKVASNFDQLEGDWHLGEALPFFFRPGYLNALSSAAPNGISFLYGIVYRGDQKVALFCFQTFFFDAEQRLKLHTHSDRPVSYMDKIAVAVKKFVARKVSMKVVVAGTLMAPGPYGFLFWEGLSSADRQQIIQQIAAYFLKAAEDAYGVSMFIVKDLPQLDRLKGLCAYTFPSFYEFTIQPTMVLKLRSDWNSLDDYMNSLQSKYRVKTRKVLKLGEGLEEVAMDSFNFQPYKSIVFELYQQVSIAAGFNLIELHPDYFQTLLEHCSDNFGLKIIFYQSKPIAFYSYIIDGEVFQAHFIGYERSYNNNLELYHNILLRLLQTAINVKAKEINFARTALEIKSSVGAEPHDLFCYIAHKSKIINSVVPHILEFLKPKDDWIQRRPFKDSNLVVNPLLKS
ncbi:MAG: hypothetical protein IPP06_11165 [Saprospiraceae bacterium]|nr:hypothetical protein [Candidatus Vicinibacter affinis]MBK8405983.1 hypothetical protein [Candidatus Vicinibacter affinis]MBK9961858.1 hypothetical protein [Candidatus Vicinibacter affinis]